VSAAGGRVEEPCVVSQGQNQDSYVRRLHVIGVVTLAVMTVGLGLTGLALRPSRGGFTPVPIDMTLYVTKAPTDLAFTETLSLKSDGGAILTLDAVLDISDVKQEGAFTLIIDNLGTGVLCTPSKLPVYDGTQPVRVPLQHFMQHPTLYGEKNLGRGHHLTGITGTGPFQVHLCWPSNGPVSLNGAYLNARFPYVLVSALKDNENVARDLDLGEPTAPDYTVQSLQPPTSVTDSGWQWGARADQGFLQALNFTAVNTSETQHDANVAFISGVVLGLAGGALIALIQELVAPFRTRKELRPPEPGG
jgi:hypothetical protein